MAAPRSTLTRLYRKHQGRCAYCGGVCHLVHRECGRSPPGSAATVDHKIPKAQGGKNDPSNVTLACHSCNQRKAAMTADEFAAHRAAIAVLKETPDA
jgi:5-methylcytosine-specific restriction endonuclease McrA